MFLLNRQSSKSIMNIRKKLTSKQKQNKQKKTTKPKQPYTIQLAPGCPSLGFPYPVMYSPPPRTVKHVSFYTQKKRNSYSFLLCFFHIFALSVLTYARIQNTFFYFSFYSFKLRVFSHQWFISPSFSVSSYCCFSCFSTRTKKESKFCLTIALTLVLESTLFLARSNGEVHHFNEVNGTAAEQSG